MKEKVIIIGSGIASISAIKAIREINKNIDIDLINEEKFYPYSRIKLSKRLLGELEEDKLLLQKKEWYDSNNINIYKNTKVISIDTVKNEVKLSNGMIISYTKLLLANGAHNFTPPISGINKKGVFTLRTLEDSIEINEFTKNNNSVLIIGGGILGLETAWTLSQFNKKVILSEIFPRLMPRQLDENASQILTNSVKSHGIEILFNTQIKEILGDDKVSGFTTQENKNIDCDMVIYSAGIRSNIDIVNNTNIKTNKGIIVDENMRTNVENIYAAGDVAEFDGYTYGLWNVAIEQGKTAGYNIIGKDIKYTPPIPATLLNAFNLSIFSMGVVDENKATNVLVEKLNNGNYQKVLINNGKVIGAIVINDMKKSSILKIAIEKEIDLSDINIEDICIDDLINIIGQRK
ncbi:nitrite reductase NasD [Gottschalkia purinilytica]|uniref:Nitrite reductase NasD n=1 Tax=Gottschalkia purinilytica TaxID=1503 RepID=A0A0L0WDL6_GOTPU|nr:FAD-dependent oxidoreductase [Gottschalkia purinilytica]KNF09510.1 nitrite reductase NasD [Gottschalkia purinilytica]